MSRTATMISHCSRSSRRTMAEPTMPRWPATNTRLPAIANPGLDATGSGPFCDRLMLHGDKIRTDHLAREFARARFVAPAQFFMRLGGVADQKLDFRRSKIARIHLDQAPTGFTAISFLICPGSLPDQANADILERPFDEGANRNRLPSGEHIVVRFFLLQHQPHTAHIFACMAPIASG